MELIRQVEGISIDLQKLEMEVSAIISNYEFNYGQLCLTHTKNCTDFKTKLYHGTGSLLHGENPDLVKEHETSFTEFNKVFSGGYLEKIYKSIPNIGRMRIMIMDGPKCYTVHKDFTKRYHIAVNTNKKCFFVFPDHNELLHIPSDGNLYLVDTINTHTFINGSRDRRIHIVMDDISTYLRPELFSE